MCPETMRIVLPVHQATKTEGRHSCPLPETSGLLTSVGEKQKDFAVRLSGKDRESASPP